MAYERRATPARTAAMRVIAAFRRWRAERCARRRRYVDTLEFLSLPSAIQRDALRNECDA